MSVCKETLFIRPPAHEKKKIPISYAGVAGLKLFYFGARYYNADLGMFIGVDPVEQFTNRYSYCGANPICLVDPNGLLSFYDIHGNLVDYMDSDIFGTDVIVMTDHGGVLVTYPGTGVENESDFTTLAGMINGEARGTTLQEKLAVGEVPLNRTQMPNYSGNAFDVIMQASQFSCTNPDIPHNEQNYAAFCNPQPNDFAVAIQLLTNPNRILSSSTYLYYSPGGMDRVPRWVNTSLNETTPANIYPKDFRFYENAKK